ncbi:MAG TPA: hypothetical protein VFJ98_04950 [Mycobacteriales bacterium]|nr:hypothetical protein [Mycobacteriales bacterium]
MPLVALFVLAIVMLRAFSVDHSPPQLRTSCTHPAVALSVASQQQHSPVQWSATGPAGMVFELTLGVSAAHVRPDGTIEFVPDPGRNKTTTERASQQKTMPKSCKTHGTFGVLVPPGAYTVRMFRLTGPVSAPSVEQVATAPLAVTPDR